MSDKECDRCIEDELEYARAHAPAILAGLLASNRDYGLREALKHALYLARSIYRNTDLERASSGKSVTHRCDFCDSVFCWTHRKDWRCPICGNEKLTRVRK